MLQGSRYLLTASLTMAIVGWVSSDRVPSGHPIWWLAGLFGACAVTLMIVGSIRGEKWQ